MGNLYDGDRVFDAVADTDASSTSINELQDQLKVLIPQLNTMAGAPRSYSPPVFTFSAFGSAWAQDDESGSVPMHWEETTHVASSKLFIPVLFPNPGSVIRAMYVYIKGASTETGGDISLWRQDVNGSGVRALVAAIDASDPWASDTIVARSATGLGIVISATHNYYIVCANATGSIVDNYVYGAILSVEEVAP